MKSRTARKDKAKTRRSRVTYKVDMNQNRYRLDVYRSNKYIYAQIIDKKGDTLVSVNSRSISKDKDEKGKIDNSYKTGKLIAEKAKAKKIKEVVFNRGGYRYHGRVEALAKGARDGGLKF
jgi:large subunit ribosomal protein L18